MLSELIFVFFYSSFKIWCSCRGSSKLFSIAQNSDQWNRIILQCHIRFWKKWIHTTISKLSDLVILKHNFQYLLFLCRNYDDCSMLLSACLFQNKPNKQNYEDCWIPTTYYNHRSFYTKIINIESCVSKLLNHPIWKL